MSRTSQAPTALHILACKLQLKGVSDTQMCNDRTRTVLTHCGVLTEVSVVRRRVKRFRDSLFPTLPR
jgi:hypothetical protein